MIKRLRELFKRIDREQRLPPPKMELDPSKRNWEYDGDGTPIYKESVGNSHKTPIKRIDEQNLTDVQKMDRGFNGKTYTINGIEGDF